MGFLMFLGGLIAIVLYLFLWYVVAKEFYEVAVDKGYDNKKYFWFTFALEFIGIFLVMALPQKGETVKIKKTYDDIPNL